MAGIGILPDVLPELTLGGDIVCTALRRRHVKARHFTPTFNSAAELACLDLSLTFGKAGPVLVGKLVDTRRATDPVLPGRVLAVSL